LVNAGIATYFARESDGFREGLKPSHEPGLPVWNGHHRYYGRYWRKAVLNTGLLPVGLDATFVCMIFSWNLE
jgi:hypothetical protein